MKSWTNRPEQENTASEPDFTAAEGGQQAPAWADRLPPGSFFAEEREEPECDGQISISDEAEKESVITAAAEGGKITINMNASGSRRPRNDETMGDLPEMERTVVLLKAGSPGHLRRRALNGWVGSSCVTYRF